MNSNLCNMITFVEWIQQWRFTNYEFKDLTYEINHRWTTFPTRNDLNNHHYLRSWLETNGASESMLITFDKAWTIYMEEKDLTDDLPGSKIRKVELSLSKDNDSSDVPLEERGPEGGITGQGLKISLTNGESSTLMSCLDLAFDYINWSRFSGFRDSRYSINAQHLDSIKNKLGAVR